MFPSTWTILKGAQAQYKPPEDGPGGPKHVGANVGYFNINFNILCLIKSAFVGKREFIFSKSVQSETVGISMHCLG